ncbi:MAG TPA: hypothetical protein VGH28_13795 [Polyangiaceae bacterium]|jgi:hypothetical protein
MTTSPFDASPARRPTLQDLGGGAKTEEDPKPNPVTMITADDANQWGNVGAGVGAVCPLAIVVVTQTAGAYSVASVRAPGTGVVAGTFTVTKNATGDVTLSWTAGVLPGTIAAHASLQGGLGDYGAQVTLPSATSVEIKIKDNSGTAQECSFTIFIY